MTRRSSAKAGEPSQRQLRVGELLREALVEVFARAHIRDPILAEANVTVTEVRATPDLRHAKVYVMPLGGRDAEALIAALRHAAPYLRAEVTKRVRLKRSPELGFELDRSFDQAGQIEALLRPGTEDVSKS